MKICISSQWDNELLSEYAKLGVNEIYCSLRVATIGSARPAVCLPDATVGEARKHIALAHSLGMEFNYVANSSCLGNIEFSQKGRDNLIEFFELVDSLGVDIVTLAVPYLIELVKKEFPRLKIKVSEIANVSTVQRAKFYAQMGVDIITIEIVGNRNFKSLEAMREALYPGVELEIVVNAGCIFHCPYHDYHNNMVCHTTQESDPLGGFYMDYCMLRCVPKKLLYPEEIIKAPWVRPEDLSAYEGIGIDRFKISNRVGPRGFGLNCLKHYVNRTSPANLADLLTPLSLELEPPRGSRLKGFSEEEWQQVVSVWNMQAPKVVIDSTQLDGFIDYFKSGRCYAQCGKGCNYCTKLAARVVQVDRNGVKSYVEMVDKLSAPLLSLREHFLPGSKGIAWSEEAKYLFEDILRDTPVMFRTAAQKNVSKISEAKAKERSSDRIEREDVIRAFVSETPQPFQQRLKESFNKRGIEIQDFLRA